MSKNVKDIYMVGIGGIAMGTLAGMLKSRGHNITGSDENIYPPMSDLLKRWEIDACSGFDPANIGRPDLAIIGNVVSRGNVEAEHILNTKVPYLSMAQALYNFFLKDKEVISISGTHGKTTTTALMAHILVVAGTGPSFFIGGVAKNYNTNFMLDNGKYFVIEGDEYDSAFFEKIPKFILYRPYHAVLTSLEFDHADIYSSLDEIKVWFKRLVNIIPSTGNIVFSNGYRHLEDVVAGSFSRCLSFGNEGADFTYEFIKYSGQFSELKILSKDFENIDLKTMLMGDYNYQNITAAVAMALKLGLDIALIKKAVASFEGVKRRQELIYDSERIKIFDDFAHHPTSIRSVLGEMKKKYSDATIWAVYEPRSATSRRNIFQEELPQAFFAADKTIIKQPYKLASIPENEQIDIEKVLQRIKNEGKDARIFSGVDEIVDTVFSEVKSGNKKNIIVIMSNGGFDGIYAKMIKKAETITQKN